MNRDILLVVKSPVVASMLSQHLTNVDVCAFGTSMLGGHYTLIVACDPLDTPQAESWWQSAIAARYPMAARYFAGRNIGPMSNMPQPQERMGLNKPPSPMPMEPIAPIEPVQVDVPLIVPETEVHDVQPEGPVDPEPSPLPPPVTEAVTIPVVDETPE